MSSTRWERWPTLGDHGAIKVRAGDDELVLLERPRLLYLIALGLVALVALPIFLGGVVSLFATHSQHLVCDRHRDVCERDGVAIALLHDVSGAELTERAVRSGGGRYAMGYFKSVTLVLRDGSRKNASDAEVQSDASVAEYRAAVDAIRAFLANPSQQRFETTFTYRPSWSERIYTVCTCTLPLLFVMSLLALWPASSYTFVQGTMSAKNGKRFGKKLTYQLPIEEIAVIGDRDGRGIDLQLGDGSRILLAHVRHGHLPKALLPAVEKALGKPVERH